MSTFFVANSGVDRKSMWLTTAQVAERLHVSTRWVRWLARSGEIAHLITGDGQRLFRREDVYFYAEARTQQQERGRPAQLAAARPRMVYSSLRPRQMSLIPLLLRPALRMVPGGERADPHAEVKAARLLDKAPGSESESSVNRRVAGRR